MRLLLRILRLLAPLAVLMLLPPPAAARPWLCLPPAFDQGRRLHPLPTPEVYWLQVLLRQHEFCWRPLIRRTELRVAVIGSSAVYGWPLPVEETFIDLINQQLRTAGISAHLFNLAFVAPYQLRDAVIIQEIIDYEPDVILYPMTLAEFRHIAPMLYPALTRFFLYNHSSLATLTADAPMGLEDLCAAYARSFARTASHRHATDQLYDTALYVRRAARATAESLVAGLNSPRSRYTERGKGRQTNYSCAKTRDDFAREYRDWKTWSVLPYLAELQQTHGIRSLVVNWPVAHEPIDDCYSIRYTNAGVADFASWLRTETANRNLAYLDLHDLLPAELFLDSIHVTATGHRRIADHIMGSLEPLLQDVAARRDQAAR